MDISLVARAPRNNDGRGLRRTALSMAGLVVITAVDVHAAVPHTIRKETATPMELTSTTTVTRPPEEVYAYWLALEQLPRFMAHLDEVRMTGPTRSRWRASAPFGKSVEWEAETIEAVP